MKSFGWNMTEWKKKTTQQTYGHLLGKKRYIVGGITTQNQVLSPSNPLIQNAKPHTLSLYLHSLSLTLHFTMVRCIENPYSKLVKLLPWLV